VAVLRRLATVAALMGVLLHAYALVRHAPMEVAAKLQHTGLVSSLATICHNSGDSGRFEIPYVPLPATGQKCPECVGVAGTLAIEPPGVVVAKQVEAQTIRMRRFADVVVERSAGRQPPPRGPPAIA
jgi:hypothetical protein